jgi:hypothetical protein
MADIFSTPRPRERGDTGSGRLSSSDTARESQLRSFVFDGITRDDSNPTVLTEHIWPSLVGDETIPLGIGEPYELAHALGDIALYLVRLTIEMRNVGSARCSTV